MPKAKNSKAKNKEDCRVKLNPSEARFYDRSEGQTVLLRDEKEVKVMWDFGIDDNYSEFELFLQEYTWATNKKPQKWVENPVVDNVELDGIWRQVHVLRVEGGEDRGDFSFRLILVLRRGWAEEINWDEAFISKHHGALSNTTGAGEDYGSDSETSAFDVRFPSISPYASVQISETLPATKDGIDVKGNINTGTFHKQMVDVIEEDDGSHTIVAVYSKPQYTLESYSSWLLPTQSLIRLCWGVPKDLAQSIITAETDRGSSVEPSFSKNQELVNLRIIVPSNISETIAEYLSRQNCDIFWYSTIYLGESSSTAHPLPETSTAGVTWDRDVRLNSQGTYDIIVKKGVRQYRLYDWRLAAKGALEQRTIKEQLGVTTQTLPDISAPDAGTIYDQNVRIREDCSKDVSTNKRESTPHSHTHITARTELYSESTTSKRNQESKIEAETREAGEVTRATSQVNAFGTYDGVQEKNISVEAETTELNTAEDELQLEKTNALRNQEEVIEADASEDGKRTFATSQINEYGRFDGKKGSVESKESETGELKSADTALYSEETNALRNQESEIEAGDYEEGKVHFASSQKNAFGRYDGKKGYRESKLAETEDQVVVRTPLEVTTTNEFRNRDTAGEAPSVGADHIGRASSRVNEFGKFDGSESDTQPYHQSTNMQTNEDTALSTTSRNVHVNSATPHEAGSHTAGSIKRATNSINRFNRYDGILETEVAKPAETGDITSADNSLQTETSNSLRNQSSAITAESSSEGTQTFASSQVNAFGRFDGRKGTIESKPASTDDYTSADNSLQTETSNSLRNQEEVIEADDSEEGKQTFASSQVNAFGRFDGKKGTIESKEAETDDYTSRADAHQTATKNNKRNQEEVIEADDQADGKVNFASSTINAFGRYDGHKGYSKSTAYTTGAQTTRESEQHTVTTEVMGNQESAITPDSKSQGTETFASCRKNEYGRYDGKKGKIESTPVDNEVTYQTDGREVTLNVFRNHTSVPTPSGGDEGEANSLSFRIEEDGTYSGMSRNIGEAEDTGSVMDSTKEWTKTYHRRIGGKDQKREVTYKTHYDFGTTINNALSSVEDSAIAPAQLGKIGGFYRAVWTEKTDDGSWDDE